MYCTRKNRGTATELWCWRRLLKVPWTTRKSNQSILNEINPVYSLEGLMLKLKLQYLATWCGQPTHRKRFWCWQRWRLYEKGMPMVEMVGWYYRLNGHKFEQTPGDQDREGWHAAVRGVAKSWTWLRDWTTQSCVSGKFFFFFLIDLFFWESLGLQGDPNSPS